MRKLRALKSPYVDVTGKPIYHGNILGGLFCSFIARCRDGVWYKYDSTGIYMDSNNRWSKLESDTYRIVDDQITLVVCDE